MTSFWTRIGFSAIHELALDVVDVDDRTFDILRSQGNNLKQSVQAAGMAYPILVQPISNDHFRIISGFHRYVIAQSLQWEVIPARILQPDASFWEAFKHIFWIKSSRNDSHPAEWAGIIRLAKILDISPRPAIEQALQPLACPISDHLYSLVWKLAETPVELTDYLLQYPLSFRQVERLVLIPKQLMPKLAAWGSILRIRTQELLDVGEQLDVFYRTYSAKNRDHWLKDVESKIVDQELPRDERLFNLKSQLDQAVRPKLNMQRQKKREIHRQLQLPQGLQISWDNNLEKDNIDIKLSVTHAADLDNLHNTIIDPVFKAGIAKLLSADD